MRHLPAPVFALALLLAAACSEENTINVNSTGAGGATSSSTTANGTGGEGGTSSTSTSTASSTSTTTGGTGGQGGAPAECAGPEECPGADTECSVRTCIGGTCDVELVAAGTPCSAGVCLDGACGECATADDCTPVPTGPCKQTACIAGSCGIGPKPDGTPLPDILQNPGDCVLVVCDGNGEQKGQADPTDVPPSDGLVCTDEVCNGTTPAHVAKPDGTPCLVGSPQCGNSCVCIGGSCGMP